jgi:hypothetical protein
MQPSLFFNDNVTKLIKLGISSLTSDVIANKFSHYFNYKLSNVETLCGRKICLVSAVMPANFKESLNFCSDNQWVRSCSIEVKVINSTSWIKDMAIFQQNCGTKLEELAKLLDESPVPFEKINTLENTWQQCKDQQPKSNEYDQRLFAQFRLIDKVDRYTTELPTQTITLLSNDAGVLEQALKRHLDLAFNEISSFHGVELTHLHYICEETTCKVNFSVETDYSSSKEFDALHGHIIPYCKMLSNESMRLKNGHEKVSGHLTCALPDSHSGGNFN